MSSEKTSVMCRHSPCFTQPGKARNDYQACWHAIWSEPEGSSHSGNIVCRGVAGGVTTLTNNRTLQPELQGFRPLRFFLSAIWPAP